MPVTGPKTGFVVNGSTAQTFNQLEFQGQDVYGNSGLGVNNILTTSPTPVGTTSDSWAQISMGYGSTALIKTNGTLWMCGYNSFGNLGTNNTVFYSSPVQVGALTNWQSVSLTHKVSAAVKTDGTLWFWGNNGGGAFGLNTIANYSSPVQVGTLTNWKQVACGYYMMAAVKTDGTLWACGNNGAGQLGINNVVFYSSPIQVGALTTWQQVSVGGYGNNTAAVKTDGTLWTWGQNTYGQLGINNMTALNYSSPVQVGALTNWKQVSVGTSFYGFVGTSFAAVKTDGTLWVWGDQGAPQNINNYYSSPIQVGALTTWQQVANENNTWCALRTDGTLWKQSPAGITQIIHSITPPPAAGKWTTVFDTGNYGYANKNSVLGVFNYTTRPSNDLGDRYVSKDYLLSVYPNLAPGRTSPGLWACGYNAAGQLGINNVANYSSPIQVGSLTNWKQVSGGQYYTVAVKTDGTLWVVGYNTNGQLGINNVVNYSSPVQVGTQTNWKQVFCGYNATAAIKTDGTLWTFGYNGFGALGTNNVVNYSSPVQVGALTNWKQVSVGGPFHTLAVKTDSSLWAWGYNNYGQLGTGNTVSYSSPVQVGALTNWKQVSVGSGVHCTAAVKTDGTLWTWGYNGNGGLGINNILNYSSPVQVGALTNWKQVTTGYHTSAIKTDGTLWTFGYNSFGQLGTGNTLHYSSPVQVGTQTNWKQVSGGIYHTTAVKTDGTLWTFGYNSFGQLGTGNTIYYSSPVQVGTLTNWKQIAGGLYHTVAISDGYI